MIRNVNRIGELMRKYFLIGVITMALIIPMVYISENAEGAILIVDDNGGMATLNA